MVGDGVVLFRTSNLLVITKDGKGIEVDDYFSSDWIECEE